jgi:hypothetical protein
MKSHNILATTQQGRSVALMLGLYMVPSLVSPDMSEDESVRRSGAKVENSASLHYKDSCAVPVKVKDRLDIQTGTSLEQNAFLFELRYLPLT